MTYSTKKEIKYLYAFLCMFCPIQAKTCIWVIWQMSRILICVVQTQTALDQINILTQEELNAYT